MGLVAATCFGLASLASAAEPPGAPPAPGKKPSLKAPLEAEPDVRIDVRNALFGKYIDENFKANILRELARKQSLYPQQAAGARPPEGMPVWQSIGPRGSQYLYNSVTLNEVDSGRIRTILVDPANSDKVTVLTSGGGLWRSNDFSSSKPRWRVLTDNLVSTSGGSAALGRSADTLYLGIGDPFDVLTTVAGVAVKSSDGGRSWGAYVNLPGATSVRDVKVDSSGPTDVVFMATDVGLFISRDGGTSFALSAVGQAQGQSSAWSLTRSSAGWLLATVEPGFDAFAGGVGAVYVSSDRGLTWSRVPGAAALANIGRATLAVAVAGDKVVYAVAADKTVFKQADVFRSADGGLSWTALGLANKVPANPNCFQPDMNILGDQAWYNQMIVVSPADPSRRTLYIGGNLSTAKSVDGGASWRLSTSWLPTACDDGGPNLPYAHADNHGAHIGFEGGRERIIFGTDGGVFVSYDGAQSFDSGKNQGIVSLLTQTIIGTPRREDSAISGLQDTGTRARVGNSKIWNQVLGGDGEGVGWSQANNAVTLATTQFEFIARQPGLPANTGDPNNWEDGTTGIDFDNPDCFPFNTPIATPTAKADPTGLVFYNATGSRLYKTVNGAASWQEVVQFGSKTNPSCIIRPRWHAIGLHPRDTRLLALTGAGGRVIVSTNAGAGWTVTPLIGAVPGWTGFNSATAWTRNNLLYLSSESPTPGATRLAVSADKGATWRRADNGLPDVAISHIVADPRDRNGKTVYAGTWIGVYVTYDGGANWKLFGAGLPNVSVQGLYLSPDEDFLRVATYGRGIWEIDLEREHDRDR
jgi:hypothetical protein